MNNIPKPLIWRLALTLLVDAGCLFVGIGFALKENDKSFLFLSSVIFVFSLIKAIALFVMIKKKSYVTMEGIVLNIRPLIFKKANEITLKDDNDAEIKHMLDKNQKLLTGHKYRFYFKDNATINNNNKSTFLQKAVITDNLLGVEEITVSE